MSRMGKTMIIIFVLIFTFGILFVISHFLNNALEGVELEEVDIDELDSLEVADDAEALIASADLIVTGQYDGLNKTVNLFDHILPSPYQDDHTYMLGRLFKFKIDEVLKGDTDQAAIDIVHIYSLPFETEEILGKVDDDPESPDPTYISPNVKYQYVAFLKETEEAGVYQRAMEPFLFAIDQESGQLQTKSKILEQIDFDPGVLNEKLSDLKKTIDREG